MSKKVNISSVCPDCGSSIMLEAEIPEAAPVTETFPKVRGGVEPTGRILEYRISSEDLKKFIIDKARQYVQDVRIEVVPRYCEKKRKHNFDIHRSYASLRIAFSENIIKNKNDLGWFGKIGENENNLKLHEGIMKGLIDRYKYDYKMIEAWLKDYKTMEELENAFGMTEAYIRDLYMYSIPRKIEANKSAKNNESWIIFSAAPENIIRDFLTDKTTNKLPGSIRIHDVTPVTKEIVQYTVYVYPEQVETKENPHVRQILLGEEKPKK